MKQGDTIEIVDRLGTYYAKFQEIDEDRLDIICSEYFHVPFYRDLENKKYGPGRFSIARIKSIRVLNEEEDKRIM